MQQHLRDRIIRKLESLSDERGYQVLDYVEFLESRYAERPAPPASIFQRFGDAVEDSLRAGKVSATTISKAMGFMGQAMSALEGVAAAGKSVASDIAGAAGMNGSRTSGTPTSGSPAASAPSAPTTPGTPRSGEQAT
ncbi:MAG TPA: hypothetical protein VFN39_11920 [Gemmatimonadaceae bacterium]|nr:hypothetical protein [Gemmatimonadaceae bacterium]